MAHYVKCTVCGQKFNRDKIQAVKVGKNRYAHYKCKPDGEKIPLENPEDEDLTALKEYAKDLLKDDYNAVKVNAQIKKFRKEYDYTYSGMLKALKYWYEVRKNPVDVDRGVGIIPYIYKNAYDYYYALYLSDL